jgi:hypothetical protein
MRGDSAEIQLAASRRNVVIDEGPNLDFFAFLEMTRDGVDPE